MTRFTQDNTEGYTDGELLILNSRYEALTAEVPPEATGDLWIESWKDSVAARVLADFDGET